MDAASGGQLPALEDRREEDAASRTATPGTNQGSLPPQATSSSISMPPAPVDGFPTSAPIPSSWSQSSERQLGRTVSPDPSDRVFPIRSVVSVDLAGRTSGEYEPTPRAPDHGSIHVPGAAQPSHPSSASVVSEAGRQRFGSLNRAQIPTPGAVDPSARARRNNSSTGPISSIQADAARHASVPLALFTDTASLRSEESATLPESMHEGMRESLPDGQTPSDLGADPLVTVRFQHVMTDGGHAIITGRDGTIQRCEDEPIHAPGAVQGFGLLIAIEEPQEGQFTVRYVSENSARLIGYTPQQLFRLDNFLDILSEEQQDNLLDHIDFIRDEDADPAVNGPEVFSLSIKPSDRRKTSRFWCAIHISPVHPHLIICELELDDDPDHPLRPAGEITPDGPEDTLEGNPTLEELTESTEILSKPLRVLRSARKRSGEAGAMQVFDIMSQVQEQLAAAENLDRFLKILVGIVKELTGFHRVMIYQFDSSFNGKVVTEVVDTTRTRDLYRGLHFPASDIPKQARDLYKMNKVRLLYDRDLETARLVCRTKEDLEVPLDMSYSYLRALSPIHLKYLANMAVRSSMSISMNAFNELWGLIACHSYGPKGMRVSFPIRKMCRLVGETASRNIERLSYASRLQARKLINTAPTDKNPSGYIIASSDDLLKLFAADFGMLSIRGETKILGKMEQTQEALAMLEYLRVRKFTSVVTSPDVRVDFPDLRYAPGFQVIAGLLYVPLSVGGNDFIVFFRKGQAKQVRWAGNPYEKVLREGTVGYLEPRTSFKTWYETVLGKCREWTEEQVETAAVLCLVYGKFIEVWRQKEAALQSSRLTRLLLANSAHEVRTPLNAIINYLEIALEGTLDQETRANLAKSHSASKSLIYVINDLLDLTMAEEGQNLVKDEIFDLSVCIQEATEPFRNDAKRKGISYEVTEHPGLPRFVHGDSRRLRQAVSNVTANAVQNTDEGSVQIEAYVAEVINRRALIEFSVQDTGRGMDSKQLDALFRELEQVTMDMDEPIPSDESPGTSRDNQSLGLGLAIVARIVRNMDGQLRLKSDPGKGSRFVIQLPFLVPDTSPDSVGDPNQAPHSTTASSIVSVSAAPRPADKDEVTLVDRPKRSSVMADGPESSQTPEETRSVGSAASRKSRGSKTSGRSSLSDADRLINAIQTSFTLGEREVGDRGAGSGSPGPSSTPSTVLGTTGLLGGLGGIERLLPSTADVVGGLAAPMNTTKISEEAQDRLISDAAGENLSGVSAPVTDSPAASQHKAQSTTSAGSVVTKLRVLVADDDPINVRLLKKRLEKAGHDVDLAVNGQDCAAAYEETSPVIDVILMDMQMPIVDGLGSTKLIRAHEHAAAHKGHSQLATHLGRVPIFAVSASLVESEKDTYVGAGFDGWIMKPIDFKRLSMLLQGITDDGGYPER